MQSGRDLPTRRSLLVRDSGEVNRYARFTSPVEEFADPGDQQRAHLLWIVATQAQIEHCDRGLALVERGGLGVRSVRSMSWLHRVLPLVPNDNSGYRVARLQACD